MKFVDEYLKKIISRLDRDDKTDLENSLNHLQSVYPFNKYEYTIARLLGAKKMTLDEYLDLRRQHLQRNPFLHLFEWSSPRDFGEKWAHDHLRNIVPSLMPPSKQLDTHYSGQYDLVCQTAQKQWIRIEVKASRAVDSQSRQPLHQKALAWRSQRPFVMNFQQLKPSCCDVFVWVGVWCDAIRYWVLSSREITASPHYSQGQHRGNKGEGQLHLKHDNMSDFSSFLSTSQNLLENIIAAYKRDRTTGGMKF